VRTWVKVTLTGVALLAAGFLVLSGVGAYFALRHLDTRTATESEALREVDAVRARFGTRPPLVEVAAGGRLTDARVNRLQGTDARPVETIHILTWTSDDGELVRAEVPLWLMRFSSVNILSQLGMAPERLRLTVQDIERYGPGIVVDYGRPGTDRVLVWVD
jgi:hypothetical protein